MTEAFVDSIAVALNDQELAAVRSMSSDLQFILCENEVPSRVQHRLHELGFTNLSLFSVLGDDRASVRAFCKDQLPLDANTQNLVPAKKALCVLHTAQVVASWVVASQRVTEMERTAAETRSQRLPVAVPKVTIIHLRRRIETAHGRIPDNTYPCTALIERCMEELEEGSWSALPLSDVISCEKGMEEQCFTELTSSTGTIRVRKTPKSLPMPRSTEDFRNRMNTLAILLAICALKHSNRLWLKSSSLELWRKYTEHILGENVASNKATAQGQEFGCSWEILLNYEFQIRKLACKKVLYEDKDVATALEEAMADLQIKEKHFITPMALMAAATGGGKTVEPRSHPRPLPYPPKGGKGKGDKGSGKGKYDSQKGGQGKASTSQSSKERSNQKRKDGKSLRTPDGRLICMGYQSNSCTYGDKCRFVHVCSKCFGEHMGSSCNK